MTPRWSASLCVLSSSSGGNCSAVLLESGGDRSLVLLDAGLSPRRTRLMLAEAGVADVPIRAIILTHLDRDHWNPGWLGKPSLGTRVLLHESHKARAERENVLHPRAEFFADPTDLLPGLTLSSVVLSHDAAGVAAFRLHPEGAGSLGYATDLGRATAGLIDHLHGVDVLAIESNYCYDMQMASNRPGVLKDRIMGGSGHLSNSESARAASLIAPRQHTVLLHLSRECNTPERAAQAHAACRTPLTIARPDRPSAWVPLMPSEGSAIRPRVTTLFTTERLPFPTHA